jgi:uroporphyrinogen-III synthase
MKNQIYLFSTSSHPDATSINSLDIKLLKPNINFSSYEYLIITSKQAVKALKQYDNVDLKAICVSKKTAQSYRDIGADVLDVGDGYGDSLIDVVEKYPKETKWLYLRAKEVASHFVQGLKAQGYSIDEVIVYKSSCTKDILETEVQDNVTLIFTSPSAIRCFLKNNTINKKNKVIVIGKSTASALPKNINYVLSYESTIDSCITLAKSN